MHGSRLRTNLTRNEEASRSLADIYTAAASSPVAQPGWQFPIKKASFPLFLSLHLTAILLILIGAAFLIAYENSGVRHYYGSERYDYYYQREKSYEIVGAVAMVAGGLAAVFSAVIGLIYLWRAWAILRPDIARTTPGKAVGFLFIPLFNIYWLFQAFPGWVTDYHKHLDAQGDSRRRRPTQGPFITACVLNMLPFLGILSALVFWPIVFSALCRAINEEADSRAQAS
jgi:hypothetical protein